MGIVAGARRAYDDLARVLVPLIGEVGVTALTTRALHLAQREFPSARAADPGRAGSPLNQVNEWLESQDDPEVTTNAAAAMLSTIGELLVTFIGEPLTMRLLPKAWPDGFPDGMSEETLK
ncbi:MAG: hypothetical protein ACXV7D_04010 [Thermoanaerobaculia bacterium]